MAHLMELLEQGAKELGLELSGRQLDQFQVYWDQLDDWNRRVNLTAIKGCDQVQIRHFLDSLTLIPALQPGLGSAFSLADVGTGAGFPGLPLKLALPEIRLTMIESVGKKARSGPPHLGWCPSQGSAGSVRLRLFASWPTPTHLLLPRVWSGHI